MTTIINIQKSPNKQKKWMITFKKADGTLLSVHFGANGYDDYTIHKDPDRMRRYQARHKNDNIDDPFSAGALSWYILWSDPTFEGGLRNYLKRFNIKNKNVF